MIRQKNVKLLAVIVVLLMGIAAQAQKTYVVAVGLNNYDNGENPLPCSVEDAKAISHFFNDYNRAEVFMLVDKNATRDHILRVLKSQFAKSGPDDEVIFAYSGHGFDGGISCYDTKNVIFCSEIQKIMRECKARRKVMFINACHSGSFSKKYDSDPRGRGYKSNDCDVMLYMSSRANELSWESYGMSTSYFYNRLIKAMGGSADANKDGKVTARELFNYVNKWVPSDTGGKQHPQMYGKFADDMVVTYCR